MNFQETEFSKTKCWTFEQSSRRLLEASDGQSKESELAGPERETRAAELSADAGLEKREEANLPPLS
jgi:hypothetical protein